MITAATPTMSLQSTVLIVDDEAALRFPISEVLRDAGVTVLEASSADEALDRIRNDHTIRVVFSDVRMPGSMDGIGLADIIEATFANVHVILTSGNVPSQTEPFRLIIAKPYSLDLVAAQIMRELKSRFEL